MASRSNSMRTQDGSNKSHSLHCTFCDSQGHSERTCFKYIDAMRRAMQNTSKRRQGRRRGGVKKASMAERDRGDAGEAGDVVGDVDTTGDVRHFAGHASARLFASGRSLWLATPATTCWNADTGASAHMTPHRNWFRSYSPHVTAIRLANNTVIYSAGLGSVAFQPVVDGKDMPGVVFHDVLQVPDLASNLLSVFHLSREKGYRCEIQDTTARFYHSGEHRFNATINDRNTGYLDGRTIVSPSVSASLASACPMDLNLWHHRFSHLHYDHVQLLLRKKLVKGMTINSKIAPDPICEPCIAGKQHRHNVPRLATRPTRPLALVVSDLKGPMPVATREGYRYWITFICSATRFWTVMFLKKKSDAFDCFKIFKAYAETELGVKIMSTLDDKGGEYIGKDWDAFCRQHGIQRRHTETDEPYQNGLAERANRIISDGCTTMMEESKLPPSFWDYAVRAYVHVRNRSPTSALNGEIPYTLWKNGKKPNVDYFRVFGCLAYVLIRKGERRALQPHTRKCIFVGYATGTRAWLFWDPVTQKSYTSSNAVFDERCFPGNSKSIDLFGSPMADANLPDTGPDDDSVEVLDQGGDSDDDDDPAPPPHFAPQPPPLPAPPSPHLAPQAPPPPPIPPLDPAPVPNRRANPPRAHRPQGSLKEPSLRPVVTHSTPTPGPESPDPLLLDPPPQPQEPHLQPQAAGSDDDELLLRGDGHEEDLMSTSEAMQCAMNYVFLAETVDYLSWEDAAEFALSSVFHSASKAQEQYGEPRTFRDAMQRPPDESARWFKAATDEINSLVENGTFQLVQLPPGRKAIGSRWVFRVKRNASGEVERYKGRLVAKGFAQRPGFDYNETFAPTPKWASLRAILALAALEDLELESIDISTAYLNGVLEEDVYMEQPEGFEQKGPDWVWKLMKSIYGLKQAGRRWHERLNDVLTKELGFVRLTCEHSVWVYRRGDVRIIIPVFVDDMTIAAKSKDAIQGVKDDLRRFFKLHDLGPTSWLLGVEIKRDRSTHTLTLSQRQYILDVLERFNMSDCDTVSTPLEVGTKLNASMCPTSKTDIDKMRSIPYINAVGALAYLAVATRPDIAYTVGVLARYSVNPGMGHWKAVKHLMRYLKGTLDLKLTYSPTSDSTELFTTYTDADHGGNPDGGRSTSGYVVKMGTGAISWASRLQSIVSLSTTEAEFVASVSAGQEILWLRNFFTELGYTFKSASTLHIDNQSALSVAKNPEHHGRMKHLDLRFYWLRDEVAKGKIAVQYLRTADMPADIMTKALARVKVQGMVTMLGLF